MEPPQPSDTSNDQDDNAVVKALENVLKNTYSLYLSAHHHHWNVEGVQFITLHTLFEEHYQDAFKALDEIAERIRSLGAYVNPVQAGSLPPAPTSKDADARAQEMTQQLITLTETVVESCKDTLSVLEDNPDPVSEDLLIVRMATHEKNLWILKSLIK